MAHTEVLNIDVHVRKWNGKLVLHYNGFSGESLCLHVQYAHKKIIFRLDQQSKDSYEFTAPEVVNAHKDKPDLVSDIDNSGTDVVIVNNKHEHLGFVGSITINGKSKDQILEFTSDPEVLNTGQYAPPPCGEGYVTREENQTNCPSSL